MMLRHKRGSALPEYVLPLALITSATLLAMPSGGGLNTWFQGILGQTTGGQLQSGSLVIPVGQSTAVAGNVGGGNTGSTTPPVAGGTGTPSPTPAPPVTNPAAAGTVTLTLPNGQKIAVSNYPTDLKQLIETAGASGGTIVLAQVMAQFGQKLADAGEITAAQNNEIQALANKGYRIAAAQKVMEEKVKELQALSPADRAGKMLYTEPLVFEGVTYQPSGNLAALIDATAGKDANGAQNGGAMFYEFSSGFAALTKKGLDWGTPQGTFFQTLATQILDTVDGTPNSWFALNDVGSWTTTGVANNVLSTNQSSTLSATNSAGICGVGNGNATDIQCN